MIALFRKLSYVTRASDWRLSFVPFVMGCVYMWLWWFQISVSATTLWLTFLSLVTTIGFASLGYFINEFFDKESDAKAGKINKLAYLPATYQAGVFLVAVTLTFLPWIWLPTTALSWMLIALQLALFLIYSLPVPRLKEHTYLSLVIDSGYAYVVPLLLSFYTFSLIAGLPGFPIWFYLFMSAVFFIGIRNIIIHQVRDVFKDAQSGMRTLPMILGVEKTKKMVVVVLLYEALLWLLAGVLLIQLHAVFLLFVSLHTLVALWALRKSPLHLYDPQTDELFINWSYLYLFPVMMILLAGMYHPLWLMLLPFHLALLFPYYLFEKAALRTKRAYYGIITFIAIDVRRAGSVLVNYPIYYVFRIVGIDLIKEKKSAAEVLFGKKKKE